MRLFNFGLSPQEPPIKIKRVPEEIDTGHQPTNSTESEIVPPEEKGLYDQHIANQQENLRRQLKRIENNKSRPENVN